jgi:hypothetical protein
LSNPNPDPQILTLFIAFAPLDTVECVKRYFKTPAGIPWLLLFIASQSFPRNLAISLVP